MGGFVLLGVAAAALAAGRSWVAAPLGLGWVLDLRLAWVCSSGWVLLRRLGPPDALGWLCRLGFGGEYCIHTLVIILR